MNWWQIIMNVLATALLGAAGGYSVGGWKGAAVGAVSAAVGNQAGLHQTPPNQS